jgi:hypothetical protein
VTVALGTITAGSAGAQVIGQAHGIRYVQTTMTVPNGVWSGATSCGSGFQVLSGGTDTTGNPQGIRLLTSDLAGFGSWNSVGYRRNSGFVYVVGLCMPNASAIEWISRSVAIGAGTSSDPTVLSANAPCDSTRRVASGGVQIEDDPTNAYLSATFPVPNLNLWRATVVNKGPARNFTVSAACVPKAWGLTYAKDTRYTYTPAAGGFYFPIECPTGVPIGGGVHWRGRTVQPQVHIASSGPADASGAPTNSIPDDRWLVGTQNDAGQPKRITGFVICKPA